MRIVLVTLLLALTGAAFTQGNAQPADQANTPANQKVIKDPAEYNAYMAALNTQDPTARAAAMDAFIAKYPDSIVKIDALEQEMGAYQTAGNQAKVQETANRVLQADANNVRALAIVTFIERATATTPDKAVKVRQDAEKGLAGLANWTKPQEMSDADFAKMKDQMMDIFAGAAGFGALQAKDYGAARDYYLKSFKIDPTNLQDVYQLGITYLEMTPIDKTGFWYTAKAYNMSQGNAAAQKSINDYGKFKYRKYHGGNDGWDAFVASVASQTAPGAEAAITPAPTPPEIACKVVQDNSVDSLSFSDREYVLQYRDSGAQCNKDAADKVWQGILAKQKNASGEEVKIKLPGIKVISATTDTVDFALTEESQTANKADLHVILEKPVAKALAAGTSTDVIGVFTSYVPNPFMFTMEKADLPAIKPPVKKPPVHHAGATKKKKG